MDEIADVDGLRGYLWRNFAEARPVIAEKDERAREFENEYGEAPFVGVYEYISEVFWWGVFEPALRLDAVDTLRKCAETMEVLLSSPNEIIREGVEIRIVSHLGEWQKIRQFAGVKLLVALG